MKPRQSFDEYLRIGRAAGCSDDYIRLAYIIDQRVSAETQISVRHRVALREFIDIKRRYHLCLVGAANARSVPEFRKYMRVWRRQHPNAIIRRKVNTSE